MAVVEITDNALWTSHIHGEPDLPKALNNVVPEAPVYLVIDGFRGLWLKMRAQPSGKLTPGFRPVGPAKVHWNELLNQRRGELVEISLG